MRKLTFRECDSQWNVSKWLTACLTAHSGFFNLVASDISPWGYFCLSLKSSEIRRTITLHKSSLLKPKLPDYQSHVYLSAHPFQNRLYWLRLCLFLCLVLRSLTLHHFYICRKSDGWEWSDAVRRVQEGSRALNGVFSTLNFVLDAKTRRVKVKITNKGSNWKHFNLRRKFPISFRGASYGGPEVQILPSNQSDKKHVNDHNGYYKRKTNSKTF